MRTNVFHIYHMRTKLVIIISATRKGRGNHLVCAVPFTGKVHFLISFKKILISVLGLSVITYMDF